MNLHTVKATIGAIAIGDGAVADKPLELCIKIAGFELRTIMTPEEHEVLAKLLKRMVITKYPP